MTFGRQRFSRAFFQSDACSLCAFNTPNYSTYCHVCIRRLIPLSGVPNEFWVIAVLKGTLWLEKVTEYLRK